MDDDGGDGGASRCVEYLGNSWSRWPHFPMATFHLQSGENELCLPFSMLHGTLIF